MAYLNDVSIDNENFYTLDGTLVTRALIVQRMIDSYNEKYPDSKVTDFNEGSEIRNAIESFAVEGYHVELSSTEAQRIAFLSTAYGSWLDLHGKDWNVARNIGTVSFGSVTFSIPSAVDYNILIPGGTVVVSNETGLDFVTVNDAEIKLGETSVDANVYSIVPGTIANAEAGTVTIFRDNKPSELLSVNNDAAFTGGTDPELDDEYRARILEVKNRDGFGSKEHYIRLGQSVPGVHDVILVDADVEGYTGKVIVNGNEKPLDDDILADVVSQYTAEINLVYNQSFFVEAVDYTTVDLEMTVLVNDEVEESLITDLLEDLFDGGEYETYGSTANLNTDYPGLNINESLSNYRLLSALESLPFLLQVTSLTSDGELFSRLTPDENTVLMLGDVTITQEVVE